MTSVQGAPVLWWRSQHSDNAKRSSTGTALLGIVAVGAFVLGLGWTMEHSSYDAWGAFLVAPVLVIGTAPIAYRLGRRDGDPALGRLIVLALIVKLLASLVYNALGEGLYDGAFDATLYDDTGRIMATRFNAGNYSLDTAKIIGLPLVGTGFIPVVTGIIYSLIGPTFAGGSMVFAWFGFLGLLLFTRAFRRAVPEGDHRRYVRLILFLPSLVYWSSAIGKEAWMTLTIGIAVYGAARLYTHARGGYLLIGLGLLGTAMVRPHVTIFVMAGISLGYLFRRALKSSSPLSPIVKIFGSVLLLIGSVLVLNQAKTFLEIEDFSSTSVESALEEVEQTTETGGSRFEAVSASSVAHIPKSFVSVMFRPFPWEASNAQSLVTGLEGVFLIALLGFSAPRLRGVGRRLLRQPLLLCYLTYALLFVYAFSTFGNFGLIVRERVQITPVLLAFLALPKPTITSGSAIRRWAPWTAQ